MSPAISVIVPTVDRPELMRRAVDAATGQEHPGMIEVIVVFDRNPPDESLQRAWRDPSGAERVVRVIPNRRRPGLAGARNSGIDAATGDLIAFCDDDDEWLPGKLAAQLPALDAGADFVCSGIRVTTGESEHERVLHRTRVSLADLLRDRITELHPSTFLIRAAALRDHIGLVDEDIPGSYAEDYEFLLRAARRGPLANVPSPGVLVRWYRRSHFTERWETISEALRWLLERYPEFAGEPAGLARVCGQIAFAEAALGNGRSAARWAGRTLAGNAREPRAYLALAVAGGLLSPDTVVRTLRRRGRGI
ncbi:glycosyltransferase family 2 protein [Catenuloplanes indicus]|uniref:Glycosyltransferase involved in cell wall biosynthesis n=1 Tax=Catenuloplanes indicus TaxID=137267 RepID=A0AAE3W7T5_9ACTN|nr:glycosyltransferase family 2 protein [Catenuloplanes indicus]MDQ0371066.1 glycosyltransferase involved in cell wall biosynthesis [Catenuloplanes indicus]